MALGLRLQCRGGRRGGCGEQAGTAPRLQAQRQPWPGWALGAAGAGEPPGRGPGPAHARTTAWATPLFTTSPFATTTIATALPATTRAAAAPLATTPFGPLPLARSSPPARGALRGAAVSRAVRTVREAAATLREAAPTRREAAAALRKTAAAFARSAELSARRPARAISKDGASARSRCGAIGAGPIACARPRRPLLTAGCARTPAPGGAAPAAPSTGSK